MATIVAASCGNDDNDGHLGNRRADRQWWCCDDDAERHGQRCAAGNARELVIARDMDVNSLDLSRSYCDTCQIFNTAVYETLITVDPSDPNTFVPRLANDVGGQRRQHASSPSRSTRPPRSPTARRSRPQT